MNLKANNEKKIIIFFIIFSFIYCSALILNLPPKNQILLDQNSIHEKITIDINTSGVLGSDWEIARGSGLIATINKPNKTQEGDLLILHCTIDSQGDTMIGPIGWSVLLPENNSVDPTTASWYKVASDLEPINYTVSWGSNEGYIAGIIRITGFDISNPIQATSTATGAGDVVNPSVNITKNYTLIIGLHGLDREGQGDDYDATFLETGPTVLYAKTAGVGNQGCSAGVYYEIQTNQGFTPNRTWSIGGNEDWYAATVVINLNLPIIDIITPIENEIYGVISPKFTVEITDPNLDTMWYTVDGGINNYTFTENETINQAAWEGLPDGTVTIRFYANTTFGNINFEEVNVIRDSSAPIINIISPVEFDLFGTNAPNFTVEITDPNLDTMWYTVDGGLNNYTFTENGTINQVAWEGLFDGTAPIRFYANNSLGNINFDEISVIKDGSAPIFNIISPVENELFGTNAPNFIVEITDPNLDTMWYSISNNTYQSPNITFIVNTTIEQTEWEALYNGVYTIRFYANDTLGNINFNDVNLTKDSSAPFINIISPVENDLFGNNAPNFTVQIIGPNIDTMWYTLDGGINNYAFTENGTINQAAWAALLDGIIPISFYVNDTLGNINFDEIDIIKDSSAPFINIISPVENDLFGVNAPNFIVEITDPNLDSMWYSISNNTYQSFNITFIVNGTIDQTEWDILHNGVYIIRFYANDTLENINLNEVNSTKDGLAPNINIISPSENDLFGIIAPNFTVEIDDPNLDTMWYIVDGGLNNYTFTENGTINQVAWASVFDGTAPIRFYANDTLGNINFKEVNVIRDSSAPFINIISPSLNEVFGIDTPNFTVEITDPNLDTMWYSISNNTYQSFNITFTINGTIIQMEWDTLYSGVYTIGFYANDTLGNIHFEEVNVIKDGSAPFINIISPVENDLFGADAPNFIVEIKDLNLDTMWYSISNNTYQSFNITFAINGTIDQTEWETLYNGVYTIRFYANDTLGNIHFEEVNVTKDGSTPTINIIYPVENDLFGADAPNFIVEIKDLNLDTMWYSISNNTYQSFNITFAINGTVDQTEWEALYNGVYTIRFYANDTIGNINLEEVNITKDCSTPTINIISPVENDLFGANAPNFTVQITGLNIDTIWYTVDGGINNYTFTENGTINQAAWDALPEGAVPVRFYVNDTLGNTDFDEISITKDCSTLIINIISPVENDLFGANAPNFTVQITGLNIDTMWYTVDGGINNYTFTENGTINQAAWAALLDGSVTIRFYANDTLANFSFNEVNLIKDTTAPIINIISPVENDLFGANAPNFSVEITDPNMDTMWYTVNNSTTKFIFTQNGVIDQTIWYAQTNGEIIIIFYANDTMGNLASEGIIVRKSTSSEQNPDITPIIILVSVIGGVATAAVALGILIKKGKISLEKLNIIKKFTEKPSTEKPSTEKKE